MNAILKVTIEPPTLIYELPRDTARDQLESLIDWVADKYPVTIGEAIQALLDDSLDLADRVAKIRKAADELEASEEERSDKIEVTYVR